MFRLLTLTAALFVGQESGLRVEFFVVEDGAPVVEEAGERSEPSEPTAIVALRRRDTETGELLERDVVFHEGPEVLHVERPRGERPRLVWREVRADGGTTWLGEWNPKLACVETTTWGPARTIHGRIESDAPPRMPLGLVELGRGAAPLPAEVHCLDPLSGRLEPFLIRARAGFVPGDGAVPELLARRLEANGEHLRPRTVEWRRPDGSLAGRYVYRGSELLAFQWQAGDLWGYRVEREEYDRLRDRWSATPKTTPPAGE